MLIIGSICNRLCIQIYTSSPTTHTCIREGSRLYFVLCSAHVLPQVFTHTVVVMQEGKKFDTKSIFPYFAKRATCREAVISCKIGRMYSGGIHTYYVYKHDVPQVQVTTYECLDTYIVYRVCKRFHPVRHVPVTYSTRTSGGSKTFAEFCNARPLVSKMPLAVK